MAANVFESTVSKTMKVADFIVEKAELIAALMTQGPVQINRNGTGDFSQLVWVTPNNLSFDEFNLIRKHGLDVNEVAQHEHSGMMVWVMFPADIVKLNTPFPKNPIAGCSTHE